MEISVVIPTYNRSAVLQRTLPSILEQDYPAQKYEVIVVVDGSCDGTARMLRSTHSSARLLVIEQANCGPAAARNAGARAATGDLLLFLDDDLICDRSLLRHHFAAHGQDPCLAFGPVYLSDESRPSLATDCVRQYTSDYTCRLAHERIPRMPTDAAVDANSSLPRELFLRAGGFDETFFRVREGVELGLRLWQQGLSFRYAPDAVVRQIYSKETNTLVHDEARRYGAYEVRLCEKYPQYRPFSCLGWLWEGRRGKRLARKLSLRLPFFPDILSLVFCWLGERMPAMSTIRQFAVKLLRYRRVRETYRSAAKEVGGWRKLKQSFGAHLPVLLYHRVGPEASGVYPELTVSPEQFERQLRWLSKRGYQTVTPSEWLGWCQAGAPLPRRPVMLTFDDGYADTADCAFPLLKRYGFRGVAFLVTQRVGANNTWDEFPACRTNRLISAEEIRKWTITGIEFGAHSRSHADLKSLGSRALEDEITGSQQDLTSLTGQTRVSFSYPWGSYSEEVLEHTRKSFSLAFTCEEGLNTLATPAHQLRRTMVQANDGPSAIWFRVHWGFHPFEHVLMQMRRIKSRILKLFSDAR